MDERQVLMTEIRYHLHEIKKFASAYREKPRNIHQQIFYLKLEEMSKLERDKSYQEGINRLNVEGLTEYCEMLRGLSSQLSGQRLVVENAGGRAVRNYSARENSPQNQAAINSTEIGPKVLGLGKDNAKTALNAVERAVENYIELIRGEKGGVEFAVDTFKNTIDTYKGYGENFAKLFDEGTLDLLELGKDNTKTALNSVKKALENYLGLTTGKKGGVEFAVDTLKNAIDTYKGYGENFAKLLDGGNVVGDSDDEARRIPQGFSEMDYTQFSVNVKKLVKSNSLPEGEIFIHGSRASGTASSTSDIDIILRVNQNAFDIFVQNRLNAIPVGSRLYKTIQKAAAKQKLSIFDISRDFGRNLHNDLIPSSPIKEIDFSIIVEGSPFDKGPFIPLK